ncbi:uncharacterized protein LOC131381240 [Hylobates moloch]|uniref:uncharacterized protein LOC131381240 n=1 Tax=Hylobates moloch TaxID=81572 RepID=UPI00267513E3|nr:uncharacterized protein LOC131381240 [Hylobates moloch]
MLEKGSSSREDAPPAWGSRGTGARRAARGAWRVGERLVLLAQETLIAQRAPAATWSRPFPFLTLLNDSEVKTSTKRRVKGWSPPEANLRLNIADRLSLQKLQRRGCSSRLSPLCQAMSLNVRGVVCIESARARQELNK